MRALGFILFFQIVLLAAQPCADLAASVTAAESPSFVATQSEGLKDSKRRSECPPLCVCSCCSVAAEAPDLTIGIALPHGEDDVETPRVAISYNSLIPAYHRPTIWQPPKV